MGGEISRETGELVNKRLSIGGLDREISGLVEITGYVEFTDLGDIEVVSYA